VDSGLIDDRCVGGGERGLLCDLGSNKNNPRLVNITRLLTTALNLWEPLVLNVVERNHTRAGETDEVDISSRIREGTELLKTLLA